MSTAYQHEQIEKKWSEYWESLRLFQASNQSEKPPYTIILPPPNVTGRLHMGHALGNTVQDILIRHKRMQGYETLWLPGLDHAGISTQSVVEKHLMQLYGKTRKEFDRETFLTHVWNWKEEHEHLIISQLKQLGCSLDWSRKKFTMDPSANHSVKTLFKKLFDEGLIYRGHYLVNWDPVTQTALADDEVEYEESSGFLWHLHYPIVDSDETIEIATTRPETLLGDTAIAVHPSDLRYQHLIGQFAWIPIVERKVPIIADPFVDPEFGTGAVKITPAHDFYDYEAALRHNLPMINIMTDDGKINSIGLHYAGMRMEEARFAIVKELKEIGILGKVEPHQLRIGKSYRSKAVIEPYLSKQWFVKMSAYKQTLLEIVKEKQVELIPSHFEKTYEHWIHNLRDWCISRQLWWGHRIPIWYHRYNPDEMICYAGEGVPPEVEKNPELYRQDDDVLDTWFSSALWPFSTLGWPENGADLTKFFPTSVLVTGHDILFFWVAKMILMSELALKKPPFFKTFIHGLIYGKSYWRQKQEGSIEYIMGKERDALEKLDKLPQDVQFKWEKMSKSKGNIIDPIEMIEIYGADAVRMALCFSLTESRQIDLDKRRFEEFKNFSNKLWNAARFVMMNLKEPEDPGSLTVEKLNQPIDFSILTLDDQWILTRLHQTIESVNQSLENFDFDQLAKVIYCFLWDEYCAYYLETSKPYLNKKIDDSALYENKQKILFSVLLSTLQLLHPITPFITEEIFQQFKRRFPIEKEMDPLSPILKMLATSSIAITSYPTVDRKQMNEESLSQFQSIQEIVYAIRNVRGQMQVPLHLSVEAMIETEKALLDPALITLIESLVKVKIVDSPSSKNVSFSTCRVQNFKIDVFLPQELKEKEQERLIKEKEKILTQLDHLNQKIGNPDFIEKAPKPLLEKTYASIHLFKEQLRDIESKLK